MTERIPMEEALVRVARFYQRVSELWSHAVAEAQAIVTSRGAAACAVAFEGFSNGYYYEFRRDTFSYRDADGQWQTLSVADEDEEESWDDLTNALGAFEDMLPPQDDRIVRDPATLGGFEGDLWLHLFADLDPQGCFQWDEENNGTLTIVEGLTL